MNRSSELNEYSKELNSKLRDIIYKSDINDSETKIVLNKLFSNLLEYTVNKISRIEEISKYDTMMQNCPFENPESIYTALADKKLLENDELPSFYPIIKKFKNIDIYDSEDEPDNDNEFIGVFFKCSYEKFIELTDSSTYDRDYTVYADGKPIKCNFEVNYIYVAEEKILSLLAEQYDFTVPRIYSPYSRRFAKLIIKSDDINIKNIKKIDFGELSEFIEASTITHTLVWNIHIIKNKPIPAMSDFISEYDRKKLENNADGYRSSNYLIASQYYKYMKEYKCDKNTYILFSSPDNVHISFGRNLNEDILYVLYNSDTEIKEKARVSIKIPDSSELRNITCFVNYYDRGLYREKRLNTYSDICYTAGSFMNNPYNIETGKIIITNERYKCGEKERIIYPYNRKHRYYERDSIKNYSENAFSRLPEKNRNIYCIIPFYSENIFTEDYARYMTEYLSENYPEILWLAVWREK